MPRLPIGSNCASNSALTLLARPAPRGGPARTPSL